MNNRDRIEFTYDMFMATPPLQEEEEVEQNPNSPPIVSAAESFPRQVDNNTLEISSEDPNDETDEDRQPLLKRFRPNSTNLLATTIVISSSTSDEDEH